MKHLLSIFILTLALATYAQDFKPSVDGIIFQDKEGASLNKAVFSECWCNPIYDDSTAELLALEPLVYPVPVKLESKWGLLEKDGTLSYPIDSDEPYLSTSEGIVKMVGITSAEHVWSNSEEALLSLLDSTGNQTKKYFVKDVYKGTFLASPDDYFWGLLNSELEVLLKFEYGSSHHLGEQFHFSQNGLMTFRENKPEGYNGVVGYNGKVHLKFKWKLLSYVVEDEAHIYAMREDLKRGYLNLKGEIVLPFQFDKIPRELTDSNFVVTKRYMWYVDRDLKQIGPKYQAFEKKRDVYFFKRDNKWGVMDKTLKIIIPHAYSSIMDGPRMRDNKDFKCYIVVKNGLYGLITLEGETILKPAYECLCGLGYYAPSAYYIEFKKGEVSYKFSEKGELIEKGGKSSGNCFCE